VSSGAAGTFAVFGVLVLYTFHVWWYPHRKCRRCNGNGWTQPALLRRTSGRCLSCGGDGRKLRFLANFMHGRRW
jgi:hypothetical protein